MAKSFESTTWGNIGDIGTGYEKTHQKHINITKKGTEFNTKSMKYHEKYRFPFWERFGRFSDCHFPQRVLNPGSLLGAIFGKNPKKASKNRCKNRCRKDIKK
jgi:hypothetical protein